MFRKRKQEAAEEEAIPEDLLNAIPDLDNGAGDADADAPWALPAPQAVTVAPSAKPVAVAVAAPKGEVHELLADVRQEMETLFAKELDRVEASFASLLTQMEARLRAADEQLARLEAERARLEQSNATYARKFEQLRSLAEGS